MEARRHVRAAKKFLNMFVGQASDTPTPTTAIATVVISKEYSIRLLLEQSRHKRKNFLKATIFQEKETAPRRNSTDRLSERGT